MLSAHLPPLRLRPCFVGLRNNGATLSSFMSPIAHVVGNMHRYNNSEKADWAKSGTSGRCNNGMRDVVKWMH